MSGLADELKRALSDQELEEVARLIEEGADPNLIEDDYCFTALMIAADEGDLTRIDSFLARGADPSMRDMDGSDAFAHAVHAGRYRAAKQLLREDHDLGWVREVLPPAAALEDTVDLMLVLDEHPAIVDESDMIAEAWRAAAEHARSRAIALLDERATVEPSHSDIEVWFFAAVHAYDRGGMRQAEERARESLDDVRGIVLFGASWGNVPLKVEAEVRAAAQVAGDLLDAGADPESHHGDNGSTALMVAARRHDVTMLEVLLSRGADVHLEDRHGRTAMAYAHALPDWPSRALTKEAIALLLRHGATDAEWVPTSEERKYGPAPPSLSETLSAYGCIALLILFGGLVLIGYLVR